MRQSRANESRLECNLRRANARQSKSRKRASETELETAERRASDRQCKAKRRANETEQGTSDVCKRSHVTCNLNSYNHDSVHMHKPRSLYAVYVADYKVWSGYFGHFHAYVCSSTQCTAPRHQHHWCFHFSVSFIKSLCFHWRDFSTFKPLCYTDGLRTRTCATWTS